MEESMSGLEEIFVFIGSPSDVKKERKICKKIIEEINETTAHSKGIHFSVAEGGYALTGKGRPQERINDEELKKSNLCIFILWRRFGSDTGEYSSGTEEEFNIAMKDKEKDVMLFCREIPKDSKDDPGEQLKKVLEFKEAVKKEKELLYKEYKKDKDFERILRICIHRWLDIRRSKKIDTKIIAKSMTYEISKEAIIEDKNQLEKDIINILIEKNKVPYFSTQSNNSNCILFGDIFGFSRKIYYFYSHDIITLEKLENILKIYYANFRKDFQFNYPSFFISQSQENDMHYSWFGYGYKNFIKALKEREKRYSEAGIIRPHHSESAGFIADGTKHIFYIAVSPELFREDWFEVDVGFVFENLLFDNKKYIEFYKTTKLDLPELIYDEDHEQNIINFRQKNLELKPEGFITYKLDADKKDWVSGIICKNPFYNDKKEGEFLPRHEEIIVNLRSHHPLKTDKQYYLEGVRIIQMPGFNILNIRGDW